MRYLNPKRWLDFFKRTWRIMNHDNDIIKLVNVKDMQPMEDKVLEHLDNGCARCIHLFGHIYPERVKR